MNIVLNKLTILSFHQDKNIYEVHDTDSIV